MDWEKHVKNVISHMVSALLASFIFLMFTRLMQWFPGDTGVEAFSWLTL